MADPREHFNLLKEKLRGLAVRQRISLGDVVEALMSEPSDVFLSGHRDRAIDHLVLGIMENISGREALWAMMEYLHLRRQSIASGRDEGFNELIQKLHRFSVLLESFEVGEYLVVVVSPASVRILPSKDSILTLTLLFKSVMCTDNIVNCRTPLLNMLDMMFRMNYRTPARPPLSGLVLGVEPDTERIFAHLLPPTLAWAAAVLGLESALDERILRDIMGFDLQPWEAQGRLKAGTRVRVQGDLVVEVLDECPGGNCRLAGLVSILRTLDESEPLAARLQRALIAAGPQAGGRTPQKAAAALLARAAGAMRPQNNSEYIEKLSKLYASSVALILKSRRFYARLASGHIAVISFPNVDISLDVEVSLFNYNDGKPAGTVRLNASDLIRGLLAAAAQLYQEAPFEATINETHIVSGYGVAAVSRLPSDELMLPTMEQRLVSVDEIIEKGSANWDPLTVFIGLTRLLSVISYYGRRQDLYMYTIDGKLYFKHSEHGETVLSLGGPAVVRITTLSSMQRILHPHSNDERIRWLLLNRGIIL